MSPVILGLDVSSTSTGVAFVAERTVIQTETLQIESKNSMERAVMQHKQLDSILWLSDTPEFAVIESYAFRAQGRYKHMLYEAGTMIRYTLHKRHVTYMTINPSQLKRFATGSGRADKVHMMRSVTELTGYRPPNDDVADAIWLALAGQAIWAMYTSIDPPWELDSVQLDLVTKWIVDFEKEIVDVD